MTIIQKLIQGQCRPRREVITSEGTEAYIKSKWLRELNDIIICIVSVDYNK